MASWISSMVTSGKRRFKEGLHSISFASFASYAHWPDDDPESMDSMAVL
jgi:hypothetical protein